MLKVNYICIISVLKYIRLILVKKYIAINDIYLLNMIYLDKFSFLNSLRIFLNVVMWKYFEAFKYSFFNITGSLDFASIADKVKKYFGVLL